MSYMLWPTPTLDARCSTMSTPRNARSTASAIGDVTDHQLGVGMQIVGTLAPGAVNLRRQRIEQPDLIAGLDQRIGGMRADKACASGDQDTCHAQLLPSCDDHLAGDSPLRSRRGHTYFPLEKKRRSECWFLR